LFFRHVKDDIKKNIIFLKIISFFLIKVEELSLSKSKNEILDRITRIIRKNFSLNFDKKE